MGPLLILIYPFAEMYAFYRFIEAYSFFDALLVVITSGFLGLALLRIQGRASIAGLQASMAQGQIPGNQLLHKAVMMLGALLILIPGIISDVVGLLCILPISRHLIVFGLKKALSKGLARGKMSFSFVNFGAPGTHSQGFEFRRETSVERDATVVDVTPIEIMHTDKKEN